MQALTLASGLSTMGAFEDFGGGYCGRGRLVRQRHKRGAPAHQAAPSAAAFSSIRPRWVGTIGCDWMWMRYISMSRK